MKFSATITLYIFMSVFKGVVSRLRRNCFLMSSLVQKPNLKWVQKVWARPVLRYSVREFAEIERVQREDFVEVEWEDRNLQRYGQPKTKNTDK